MLWQERQLQVKFQLQNDSQQAHQYNNMSYAIYKNTKGLPAKAKGRFTPRRPKLNRFRKSFSKINIHKF